MNGTSIVASGGNLTLNGNIIANSLTISPTKVGYLANLTQDINTSLVSLQSQITSLSSSSSYSSLSVSGTSTLNIVNISGLLTISSGISTGSYTISNSCLNYISTLSSDAQTQITNLSTSLTSANTNITALQTKTNNISYTSTGSLTTITSNVYFQTGTNNFPITTSSNGGMSLFWGSVSGVGETNFLNYSGSLLGGFTFSNCSSSNTPKTLLTIDSSGNITPTGNVVLNSSKYIDISSSAGLKVSSSVYVSPSILNYISTFTSDAQAQIDSHSTSITVLQAKTIKIGYNTVTTSTYFSDNIQVMGIIKTNSSTAQTYTSDSIGYKLTTSYGYNSTGIQMTTNTWYYSSNLSLGIGVWSISGAIQTYSTANVQTQRFVQINYSTSNTAIDGTKFSFCSYLDPAYTYYDTPTGSTTIVITTTSTNICLAFKVVSAYCYYSSYYLHATKIA
jgi:hypothetical protein